MSNSRRTSTEQAAAAASEAARVLQQRSQESRQQRAEPAPPPEPPGNRRVEFDPEVAPPPVRNEPRRRAMEEIERLHMERTGMKPEPEPEQPVAEKPAAPEPEKAPEAAPEAVRATQAAEPAPEAPAEPSVAPAAPEAVKTVRVKVDGEEFDVPQADIDEAGGLSAYRIARAQENRLRKISEALAEVKRVQADVFAKQQPAAPAQPAETDQQFIASRMDIIRFGTPEEAAKAQLEIVQRTAKPVDEATLVQKAINQIQHDTAVKKFDAEFADVVQNPLRLKLAVALRQEAMQNVKGPVDWDNFYRTIGNQVRSAFGGQSQPTSGPSAATSGTPSQPTSDKEARKAQIVNLPTAAARAEAPKEEKPETRDDILRSMRKARGKDF